MGYYEKFKNFLVSRGKKKNIQDLISLLIIGLILLIAADFFLTSDKKTTGYIEEKENKTEVKSTALTYEQQLEEELTNVLSEIDGAGKVSVMIHFESGNEFVPAFNINNSKKVTEETDSDGGKRITNEDSNNTSVVTTNEGGVNKPFITKELKPKISGIIVIAEGAKNPDVKYKLYEAVKTVFNIEQYRVNIYPMKK